MFVKTVFTLLTCNYCIGSQTEIQTGIPICPKKQPNELEYPYVSYGNNSTRCYVASRQGPRSEGSVLFAKPKSQFGMCSCECFLDNGIVFDPSLMDDYRYCFNKRMGTVFVYDKSREACFELGSQGPCPPGQILTKDIYKQNPRCSKREECANQTNSVTDGMKGPCPPGTIFSTLLNKCTDMMFTGLPGWPAPSTEKPGRQCPPGTIYSTLLNKCTDMMFTGLPPTSSPPPSTPSTHRPCPPGKIYSTLLNHCTDTSFTERPGWPAPTTQSTKRPENLCPPGTIYSTRLNICTGMNMHGWSRPSSLVGAPNNRNCPHGFIYSTLINKCIDISSTERAINSIHSGVMHQLNNWLRVINK